MVWVARKERAWCASQGLQGRRSLTATLCGGKLPNSHQNKIQLAGGPGSPQWMSCLVLCLKRENEYRTGKPVGSSDAVAGERESAGTGTAGEEDLPGCAGRTALLSYTGLPRAWQSPFPSLILALTTHLCTGVSGLWSKEPQGIFLRLGVWMSINKDPHGASSMTSLVPAPSVPWARNHLCLQLQCWSTYFIPKTCQLLSVGRNVQGN